MNRLTSLAHLRALCILHRQPALRPHFRAMSSSTSNPDPTHPVSSTSSNPPLEDPSPTDSPLSLPEPTSDTTTTTIDMSNGGSTVKLDHMGPLVVNKDGTLSRITNWTAMSEIERQNTLRILGKRNQARREALKGKEESGGGEK
jgi:hypothetical protein